MSPLVALVFMLALSAAVVAIVRAGFKQAARDHSTPRPDLPLTHVRLVSCSPEVCEHMREVA